MKISFLYGADLPTIRSQFSAYNVVWNRSNFSKILLHYGFAFMNSTLKRFEPSYPEIKPERPVFILGHFRCGTTHLNNLLSLDGIYESPNTFQASFPHIFLRSERYLSRLFNTISPKKRPQDNMRLDMALPQEEEIALVAMGAPSPYLTIPFPNYVDEFGEYIHFRNRPEQLKHWKSLHSKLSSKLTTKLTARQFLLYKSPCNMARIDHILELYPDARFIHIHRDPYSLTQSSLNMYKKWFNMVHFHDSKKVMENIENLYFENAQLLYSEYFEKRTSIAPNNLIEISYHNLVKDPFTTMNKIYSFLGDVDFDFKVCRQYLNNLRNYSTNSYKEMDPALKRRVERDLESLFDHYNYIFV